MNDSIIALASHLISLKCINQKNCNIAAEFCFDWLRNSGLNVQLIENQGYKMVLASVGGGGPKIILNGHFDVVPAKQADFSPYNTEDRLYGRGSYDMLGAVAAMMVLLKELAVSPPGCEILLSLVPNEEDGGELGTGFLVDQGLTGDFVICGEPTNLNIAVQIKGVLQVELRFAGTSSHGCRPWLGENAILKAMEAYRKIEEQDFFKASSQFFSSPSINLAKIHGGHQINQVADICNICLDIRYLPDQDPCEVSNIIKKIAPDAKMSIIGERPALIADIENVLLKKLITSARYYKGNTAIFGQDGSSDTSYFHNNGITSIEFGPSGANHHGPGEYVEIASLHSFKDILRKFIYSING